MTAERHHSRPGAEGVRALSGAGAAVEMVVTSCSYRFGGGSGVDGGARPDDQVRRGGVADGLRPGTTGTSGAAEGGEQKFRGALALLDGMLRHGAQTEEF